MQSVLIVDDEKHTRDGLVAALADNYDVLAAANADEAIKLLDAEEFDAVITDFRMSGKSGLSVIDKAASLPNKPACIMLTAYGNVETAVEAMKRGAADFLSKPVDVDKLERILKDALDKREEKRAEEKKILENNRAEAQHAKKHIPSAVVAGAHFELGDIIANSPKMREVVDLATQVAHSKATVTLTGETGTGKELIANLIHTSSPRAEKPFIPVHCAAIPSNLLESELFGYEKGAFTGAVNRRIGRFEAADGGTIFLDEIGEIDTTTQVKLLRFLETRTLERIGGNQSIKVDVRIICATNKDLKTLAEKGEFRADLYYRLNVVEINIPPLREHPSDIPSLLDAYSKYFADENSMEPVVFSADAVSVLKKYPWPGNIRELRNFCEKTVVMSPVREITADRLEARFKNAELPPRPAAAHGNLPQLPMPTKKESEEALIKQALEAAGGNKSKAAEILGISRRTLYRKLSSTDTGNP